MTDDNDKIYLEELTRYSKLFLAKVLCTQGELAEKLGIDGPRLSRMLNGDRPVSIKVLKKLRELWQNLDKQSTTPEKISVQEDLPSMPNISRESEISKRNFDTELMKAYNHLAERVAALEQDRKLDKDDSEKKIRAILAEVIGEELEQIANRHARLRDAANG